MSYKISNRTWYKIKEEMSIASDRDKFVKMGKQVMNTAIAYISPNNPSDFINAQVALEKIIERLKREERKERRRQGELTDAHQKLKNNE